MIRWELSTKKEYPGYDKTRSENQFSLNKLNWGKLIVSEGGIN